MTSPAAIADAFLKEMGSARADRNRRALDVLLPAADGAAIYGGEFADAKAILDRSFENAFNALKDANRPVAGYFDANNNVTPWGGINDTLGYASGLRSSIAMGKKAAKLKISDPYLQSIRSFLAATVPMAELVESIKSKVIKGRRPAAVSSKEKRIAGRVGGSGTCQICAGDQAIVRTKIALHGYNRPGIGFITGECHGSNELPFEVSCDALRKWIGTLRTMQTRAHDRLAELPFVNELMINVAVKEAGRTVYKFGQPVTRSEKITTTFPMFEDARQSQIRDTQHRLKALTTEIEHQSRRLDAWKPAATG